MLSLNSFHSKYKDFRIFLWLIPFVNLINYYLTYEGFGPIWRVIATFTIDTLQGYMAWLVVRAVIIWLDKKMPYESNPGRRILVQVLFTLLTGSLFIIITTEIINWLATSKPVPTSFYTKDIPIISIWFFVVNGIYVGLHYYHQWQVSEEKIKEEQKAKSGGLSISSGKKDLLYKFNEINAFYVDGDYTVVITAENKKHFTDISLDKIEKSLPKAAFFRLNRQYIVHRELVKGYEKGENGKIGVLLKAGDLLPNSIPVSRTKAPLFKSWLISDIG